jgi:hypothetical protein
MSTTELAALLADAVALPCGGWLNLAAAATWTTLS